MGFAPAADMGDRALTAARRLAVGGVAALRRAGADLPGGNLGAAHGTPMEGYYWRIVDDRNERVVVARCAVSGTGGERRGVLALGAHPPNTFVSAVLGTDVAAAPDRFAVTAGHRLTGTLEELRIRFDPACELHAQFTNHRPLPGIFGGLGVAHLAPGLPTYWTPCAIMADVVGGFSYEGTHADLGGARVHIEKNWGSGFPDDWWWGHAFFGDDASVVFAGGRIALPIGSIPATTVVLRLGHKVTCLVPPFAATRCTVGAGTWRVTARRPGWDVEIDGEAGPSPALELPGPMLTGGRVEPGALEHLAGRLALVVRSRGRLLYEGESHLAGLEVSLPAGRSGT